MDLSSKKNIQNLLEKHKTRPSKGFGQNFLIDKDVLKKIIQAAEISPKEVVLEIGPGVGNLTQELAKKAKKVIAIEKDPKMVEILKENLKNFNNIEAIQGDILKIENRELKIRNYKIVANLPYYIVSPVTRKFLDSEFSPREMILMVQKEVAQRICAKPPDMSLLAVSVQLYAKPEIIFYVPKESFWPQPKVDSAVIKLKVKNEGMKINKNLFFKIAKAGFSQPRKQILNNLSKELKSDKEEVRFWLLKNNVQPSRRAETLKVEDWLELTENIKLNK